MANLLPQGERRRFEREYRLRILTVGLSFVLASGLFGLILLLPSYFVSKSKEEVVRGQSEFLKQAVALREQDASSEFLAKTKLKINELEASGARTLPTSVLDAIIESSGGQIAIDAFYYTRSGEKGEVKITGRAPSRTSLIQFTDRLNQEAKFTRVDLPVSNLAKDSNIIFSITITGDF